MGMVCQGKIVDRDRPRRVDQYELSGSERRQHGITGDFDPPPTADQPRRGLPHRPQLGTVEIDHRSVASNRNCRHGRGTDERFSVPE